MRALGNLGYTAKSAEEMVARTAKKLGPEAPVEDIIRGALASAG